MGGLIIDGKEVKRYDVFFVDFPKDPKDENGERKSPKHSLQTGSRPGVICTPDDGLIQSNAIVYMSPISAKERNPLPFLQMVSLRQRSWIHFEQARPVPVDKIKNFIRTLNYKERRDMDMRQSIPAGLGDTNFLLYTKFEFRGRLFDLEGKKYYHVAIEKVFGSKEVLIPDKMLDFHFEKEVADRYRSMPERLPELLESLRGLKMVHEALLKYELSPESYPNIEVSL